MSSNIGKLDTPIWHGCQGHAFADYEEALTNYSIQTGTVSCLFSDNTGVIESDEQKCKQHNAVMMMALQKGAGVQWQQLRAVYTQAVEAVDAVEAEGETAAIVAVTGHAKGTPYYDAAATWANFRTHAQGKTDTTAGPALFKEVDAWSFPTTGTHVDNVAQAITELTAFQLRGQTLNDDDFQLSAAHLAHTFKSHLPGEFAIHSRYYRSLNTLPALLNDVTIDALEFDAQSPTPTVLVATWTRGGAKSDRVPRERQMDRAAGPPNSAMNVWCPHHGWCKHTQAACKAGASSAANKPKSDFACWICGVDGHLGRDCPRPSAADAENMSKTALIATYGNQPDTETIF